MKEVIAFIKRDVLKTLIIAVSSMVLGAFITSMKLPTEVSAIKIDVDKLKLARLSDLKYQEQENRFFREQIMRITISDSTNSKYLLKVATDTKEDVKELNRKFDMFIQGYYNRIR